MSETSWQGWIEVCFWPHIRFRTYSTPLHDITTTKTDTAPVSSKVCCLLPDRCYFVQCINELHTWAFALTVSCKTTWQHKIACGAVQLEETAQGWAVMYWQALAFKSHTHTISVFIMHLTAWLDQHRYATDWCLQIALTNSLGKYLHKGQVWMDDHMQRLQSCHWCTLRSDTTWDKTA